MDDLLYWKGQRILISDQIEAVDITDWTIHFFSSVFISLSSVFIRIDHQFVVDILRFPFLYHYFHKYMNKIWLNNQQKQERTIVLDKLLENFPEIASPAIFYNVADYPNDFFQRIATYLEYQIPLQDWDGEICQKYGAFCSDYSRLQSGQACHYRGNELEYRGHGTRKNQVKNQRQEKCAQKFSEKIQDVVYQEEQSEKQEIQNEGEISSLQSEIIKQPLSSVAPKKSQKEKKRMQRPASFSIEEIKGYINDFSPEKNENVNQELIEEIGMMNSLDKEEAIIKINHKNRSKGGKRTKQSQEQSWVGANQSVSVIYERGRIKKQGGRFLEEMAQQVEHMPDIEKTRREIIFNLNLLAPENCQEIIGDLEGFLLDSKEVCYLMIDLIILKTEQQPQHMKTYANLCCGLSKINPLKFSFLSPEERLYFENILKRNKRSYTNPFKSLLIDNVQQTFDRISISEPSKQQLQNQQKAAFLSDFKKILLTNVKFIAELINVSVLGKKIVRSCISELLMTFLIFHCRYAKQSEFQQSFSMIYMEAVIEFIEKIGSNFQEIEEVNRRKDKPNPNIYQTALKSVQQMLSNPQSSDLHEIPDLIQLSPDEFFKLFLLIDSKVLSKTNNRLSSLLKDLEERRDNNWKDHFAQTSGPKKLKDFRLKGIKDAEEEEMQRKAWKRDMEGETEAISGGMRDLLRMYQRDDKAWELEFEENIDGHPAEYVMLAFMKQVADERKPRVIKRISFFSILLERIFKIQDFKKSWRNCIKYLALISSEQPFSAAALAKIIQMIDSKRGIRLAEFYCKFGEEEEDEESFMKSVYQMLYFYTRNEEIGQFVDVSEGKTPSGVL